MTLIWCDNYAINTQSGQQSWGSGAEKGKTDMLFWDLLKAILTKFVLGESFLSAFLEMNRHQQTVVCLLIMEFTLACENGQNASKRTLLRNSVILRDEVSSVFVRFGYSSEHRKAVIEACDVGSAAFAIQQYHSE
jgi:hypothetical protein